MISLVKKIFGLKPKSIELTESEVVFKKKRWLVMEPLVRRFFPETRDDEDAFSKTKAKALNEIDDYIARARLEGKTPEQLDVELTAEANRKISEEREFLQHGCRMTKAEFAQKIIPELTRYIHTAVFYSQTDSDLLYQSGSDDCKEAYDAKDSLKWSHHELSVQTAVMLRKNYQTLCAASSLGKSIRILTNDNCCLSVFDRKTAKASDLISAYGNTRSSFPLFPPVETPCIHCDGAFQICEPTLLVVTALSTDEQIPIDWKETLEQKRNVILRERREDANDQLISALQSIEEVKRKIFDSEKANPDEISSLGIHELRAMQKSHGIRGYRTKIDIAQQLINTPSAENGIAELTLTLRQKTLVRLTHESECSESFILHINQMLGDKQDEDQNLHQEK